MGCCGGSNTFLPTPVPATNVDGPILPTDTLQAKKTIFLAGKFNGKYDILGSHDDVNFVPVASFSGGGEPQSVRKDVDATLKSMRVRRQADAGVTVFIAGQTTCPCPGVNIQ
jgi:hypothetical protein